MEKETVTIYLEKYEQMQKELTLLRQQVQEKTVIKNNTAEIVMSIITVGGLVALAIIMTIHV